MALYEPASRAGSLVHCLASLGTLSLPGQSSFHVDLETAEFELQINHEWPPNVPNKLSR